MRTVDTCYHPMPVYPRTDCIFPREKKKRPERAEAEAGHIARTCTSVCLQAFARRMLFIRTSFRMHILGIYQFAYITVKPHTIVSTYHSTRSKRAKFSYGNSVFRHVITMLTSVIETNATNQVYCTTLTHGHIVSVKVSLRPRAGRKEQVSNSTSKCCLYSLTRLACFTRNFLTHGVKAQCFKLYS